MALHIAAATFNGSGTLYADAVVVRTRKELRAAFQQQPPPVRIIVESKTLLGLALIALLWFKIVPGMERLVNIALEKGYGVDLGWNVKDAGGGNIKFTPPASQPEPTPQLGEE